MRTVRLALAFVFIYVGQAHAANFDPGPLLLRAKSVGEVRRAREEAIRLNVARTACRLQLRAAAIPSACYESLSLEIRVGLHQKSSDRQRLLKKLDRLCEEASLRLQVPREEVHLSPTCRSFVMSAKEIRKYRERRPEWSEN